MSVVVNSEVCKYASKRDEKRRKKAVKIHKKKLDNIQLSLIERAVDSKTKKKSIR